MSDLQLALLMLGIVIIAAVIFYNWRQERNMRLEAEERFHPPAHDVLMDDLDDGPTLRTDSLLEAVGRDAFDDNADYAQALPPENHVPQTVAYNSAAETQQYETSQSEAPRYPQKIEPSFSDDWMADDEAQAPIVRKVAAEPATEEPAPEIAPTTSAKPSVGHNPVPLSAPQREEQISLPEGVNQQIDLIALLYLSQPASGLTLREFLLSLADIDKPIYAYGLDDDGTWQLLTREQESIQFTRAVCNVQLADRAGPIAKTTLSRFQQAVDSMGAQLAAHIEWLGSADPLRYASELDQFCIEVDKMVGFHLVQGESGPFTGTKLRGLAEAGGLVLHDDGSFHHESEHRQQTFSMVNQDNTPFSVEMLRTSVIRGVMFQLDIPRVKNCQEVFNHMVLMARQMESSLNARLVDDNQRPLGDTQIEKIRQQLKVIHAKMVTRGIVPGSDNALRLFS